MELQISLISSDLEHLATNFRLLSKEFLILQDFVRQQYGNQYTKFYNQKKDGGVGGFVSAQSAGPSKSSPIKSTTTSTNNNKAGDIKRKPGPKSKTMKVEVGDNSFGLKDDGGSTGQGMSDAASDYGDNDNDFYVECDDKSNGGEDNDQDDDYVIPTDISLLYEDDPETFGRSGRRVSIVHRYFRVVTAYDGTTKRECKNCGGYVSQQAQRMRNHLIKCIQKSQNKSVGKMIKKVQNDEERNSDGSSFINDMKRSGRKGDRVRLLFTKTDVGGKKPQMKCKSCGLLVSNQPTRLKHHILNRCPKRGDINASDLEELPSQNESGGPSNEQERTVRRPSKRKRKARKIDKYTDTSDDDDETSDEELMVVASQPDPESQKKTSTSVPSTSDTSGVNPDTGTPFLTICSNDLLDVASTIGTS